MTFCWFAMFRQASPEARLSSAELGWLRSMVAAVPGVDKAIIYTPSSTSDPYLDDGPPPLLGLQFYFHDIATLEAATAADGRIQALVSGALPSLNGASVAQQAMLVRRFPVPDPIFRTPPGELPCTFLLPMKARPRICRVG